MQQVSRSFAPKHGHGAFDTEVRDVIETDGMLLHALSPMLEACPVLYQTFRELDKQTRKLTRSDPVRQRLLGAPGMGFVTVREAGLIN